jgi:hypothetical protein
MAEEKVRPGHEESQMTGWHKFIEWMPIVGQVHRFCENLGIVKTETAAQQVDTGVKASSSTASGYTTQQDVNRWLNEK